MSSDNSDEPSYLYDEDRCASQILVDTFHGKWLSSARLRAVIVTHKLFGMGASLTQSRAVPIKSVTGKCEAMVTHHAVTQLTFDSTNESYLILPDFQKMAKTQFADSKFLVGVDRPRKVLSTTIQVTSKGVEEDEAEKVNKIEKRIIQHLHQRGYHENHPDYLRCLGKAKELAIQKANKDDELEQSIDRYSTGEFHFRSLYGSVMSTQWRPDDPRKHHGCEISVCAHDQYKRFVLSDQRFLAQSALPIDILNIVFCEYLGTIIGGGDRASNAAAANAVATATDATTAGKPRDVTQQKQRLKAYIRQHALKYVKPPPAPTDPTYPQWYAGLCKVENIIYAKYMNKQRKRMEQQQRLRAQQTGQAPPPQGHADANNPNPQHSPYPAAPQGQHAYPSHAHPGHGAPEAERLQSTSLKIVGDGGLRCHKLPPAGSDDENVEVVMHCGLKICGKYFTLQTTLKIVGHELQGEQFFNQWQGMHKR